MQSYLERETGGSKKLSLHLKTVPIPQKTNSSLGNTELNVCVRYSLRSNAVGNG